MKQLGKQTAVLANSASIASAACVAGPKEGKGPLGHTFDHIYEDSVLGLKSWEKAESIMQKDALHYALEKANLTEGSLRYLLAGDLLSQCVGSAFGLRDVAAPFIGLYGACSTMAEGLGLGAMLVDGGFADRLCAITSSHFCASERQFRLPLEYGGQRPPTAQWTVTGSGAVILENEGAGPFVTHVTFGKMCDAGIKDMANMGAAMAPAAYDTISTHFSDTNTTPDDFDMIITGDLGSLGADIVRDLFRRDGVTLGERYGDCGVAIFDLQKDGVDCGGSGCGCSALVLCGHILNQMRTGIWNNVLFCGTGALFSPVTSQQGESIPSICHAVKLSTKKN